MNNLKVCKANGNFDLQCLTPELTNTWTFDDYQKRQTRSRDGSIRRILNYTVIMDNVPGPDTNATSLILYVMPDPVFTEIRESDRIYHVGSGNTISIMVR